LPARWSALVLGDLKNGIILGGTLELMALGWMNVGLAMAPDTAIASVISTILVITADQGIGEGIAVAVALAAAGQALTIFVRTITVFFIHRADKYAKDGNFKGIEIMHITAMAFQALRVMIPTLIVALISVSAVQAFLGNIPDVITKGLANRRRHYRCCRVCDGHQHDEHSVFEAVFLYRFFAGRVYRFQFSRLRRPRALSGIFISASDAKKSCSRGGCCRQ
jgi:hypothetical protein